MTQHVSENPNNESPGLKKNPKETNIDFCVEITLSEWLLKSSQPLHSLDTLQCGWSLLKNVSSGGITLKGKLVQRAEYYQAFAITGKPKSGSLYGQ